MHCLARVDHPWLLRPPSWRPFSEAGGLFLPGAGGAGPEAGPGAGDGSSQRAVGLGRFAGGLPWNGSLRGSSMQRSARARRPVLRVASAFRRPRRPAGPARGASTPSALNACGTYGASSPLGGSGLRNRFALDAGGGVPPPAVLRYRLPSMPLAAGRGDSARLPGPALCGRAPPPGSAPALIAASPPPGPPASLCGPVGPARPWGRRVPRPASRGRSPTPGATPPVRQPGDARLWPPGGGSLGPAGPCPPWRGHGR